jgi:polyhydroxyalkanoate synthesis regulator phasin
MAEPVRTFRELALAGIGAIAAGTERAEELVNDLAARGGIEPATVYRELGLVTRAEVEDLELRLAQLEHRLRLLEDARSLPPATP